MVPYSPVEQYQFVQPFQPWRMRCTPQNGPSLKTVADIKVTRRIFSPYPSGYFQRFSPIYRGSKEEWNFIHKAIVHQGELEEHIKTLDAQKDHQTRVSVEGVVNIINHVGAALQKLLTLK